MKLSIVATLYRSSPYIREFHERCTKVARELAGNDYEIILVNDGSPDESLEHASALAAGDPHVMVVDLSRNFGHHKAMMTGLAHARGERIFLLDSDLEEQPEWLQPFASEMDRLNADMVYGVQEKRRGGMSEQFSGWLFYKVFRTLTGVAQPANIVTARLMTRRYVQALIAHQERELNIGGLWITTGFSQAVLPVVKQSSSPTTYTFARKLSHLVNAVTSFSSMPLVFTFYAGMIISLSALLYIAYLVFRFHFVTNPPDGYTSIIASIWLFSGLIIFCLGVQGIYISKMFVEVKRRPYTIVRQIIGRRAETPKGERHD